MKKIIISVLILTAAGSEIFAGGARPLDFLNIEVGARPVAMGGAFTALADDASGIYYNPAGLGQLKRSEAAFTHNRWFEQIKYNYFAAAHSLKFGTLALSFYQVGYGEIQGYDHEGTQTETHQPYDLAGAVSFGTKIFNRKNNLLFAGINLKYIYENLDESEAQAIAGDIGIIYRTPFNLSLAFAARNIGPKIKFFQEEESLPLSFKFGSALNLMDKNLNLAADYTFPADEESYINTGAEYCIWRFLVLRAGFRSSEALDTGLRCGLGVRGNSLLLDYSFVPYGDLGQTHRFSLSLRFGRRYGYSRIEQDVEARFDKAKDDFYQGQLINAYRGLKEILALVPGHEGAQEYLARIRTRIEKGELAKEIQEHMEKGRKYFNSGDLTRAQAEFELVLTFEPENEEAEAYIDRIKKRFAQVIDAIFTKGKDYYEKGDYTPALDEMNKILTFDPDHVQAKEYVDLIKEKQRELERIMKAQKANEHFRKGEMFYNNKKYEAALSQFEQALELDPQNTKISEGIDNTKKLLLKKKQRLAEENFNKGLNFFNDNKLESAVGKLQQALKYDPKHRQAKEYLDKASARLSAELNKQGLIEYNKGNIKRAVEIWEKAQRYDPDNEEIISNLNRARKEIGR
jgi:tetratricopeptide (TPR) repeat protein